MGASLPDRDDAVAQRQVVPARFWAGPLVASRLLAYELWTRIHGRGAEATHGDAARELLSRVAGLRTFAP